jgi:lipopolysaccharide biosynthesis glycosyltransferase
MQIQKIDCKLTQIANSDFKNSHFLKALVGYYELATKLNKKTFFFNAAICLQRLGIYKLTDVISFLDKTKKGLNDPLAEYARKSLIISLTSYPARINTVYITLRSLIDQTIAPKKIILWLAEEQFSKREGDLPISLLKMQEEGVEIRWCSDLKSYKKLLPSIQNFSGNIIVTADDDTVYPSGWLLQLIATHMMHPSYIICHRAHRILFEENGLIKKYKKWDRDTSYLFPSFDIFFTGCGGVLYPPNSLNAAVFDKELFKNLAPDGDDIWFWAMALLNRTKIVKVPDSVFELNLIEGTQDDALWIENVQSGGNDKMIASVLAKFPSIYKLLSSTSNSIAIKRIEVSIIVPVYNTNRSLLQRCLDSLVNQSFQGLEVICVDDGSTSSDTCNILEEYTATYSNIKLISQINSGPATARNNGIIHASGDYISLVDSDDYINENFIQSLYNSITHNDANISIAEKLVCVDELGKINTKHCGLESIGKSEENAVIANAILTTGVSCNKLYRRSYLISNKIFFLNGMKCPSEDNFFTITALLLARGKICISSNSTYYYYQENNSNSITKNFSADSLLQSSEVYEAVVKKLQNYPLQDFRFWSNIVNQRAIKDIKSNAISIGSLKLIEEPLYKKFISRIDLCCIADENYIIPTMVFLFSLRRSRSKLTEIYITILVPVGSGQKMYVLESLNETYFNVTIREVDVSKLEGLHKHNAEENFCMASPAAMIKFLIPNLFNDLDRIIYIDADLIVRHDLLNLYMNSLGQEYLAAVVDLWTPVTNRPNVHNSDTYFNSGVMLMNLKKMRDDKIPEELINAKLRSNNFDLMDQDVFNEVCGSNVKKLDIKFNFLTVCYKRHSTKFIISELNKLYDSSYETVESISHNPVIVHWAGSDKPWKTSETLFADEWNKYYRNLVKMKLLS